MQITEQQHKALTELNASFRFAIRGPTFRWSKEHRELEQVDAGGVICEIVDNTVGGEPYARHFDETSDQHRALDGAIAAALKAEKPMTPAQRADAEKRKAERAALEAENAALREKLAKYEKKGRKAKDESTGDPDAPPQGAPPSESPAPAEAPESGTPSLSEAPQGTPPPQGRKRVVY